MILLSEVTQYLQTHSRTNYAALPAANTVPNELWYCSNSQGTQYITALFGGTYYPSGWYFSDGIDWTYQTTAFQASQAEVNTGTNTDKFVSPATLANSTQWATKANASGYTANRLLVSDASGVLTVNSALTVNRIPYANASGLLTDSSAFTFDGTILNIGNAVTTNQRIVRIGQDTAFIDLGSWVGITSSSAIYFTATNPTSVNYVLAGNGTNTFLNAPSTGGSISFRCAGTSNVAVFARTQLRFTPIAATTGSLTPFSFEAPASTQQTAGVESVTFNIDARAILQHASNTTITTQRDVLIQPRTHSFQTASGIITTAATFAITGSPIAGTNATITRPLSVWVQGGETLVSGFANAINTTDKTADYTVTDSDHTIVCGSGTFTITLPTAVGCAGRRYKIKKRKNATGTTTLDGAGSETIDEELTQLITDGNSITVESDNANWIIT